MVTYIKQERVEQILEAQARDDLEQQKQHLINGLGNKLNQTLGADSDFNKGLVWAMANIYAEKYHPEAERIAQEQASQPSGGGLLGLTFIGQLTQKLAFSGSNASEESLEEMFEKMGRDANEILRKGGGASPDENDLSDDAAMEGVSESEAKTPQEKIEALENGLPEMFPEAEENETVQLIKEILKGWTQGPDEEKDKRSGPGSIPRNVPPGAQ